MDLARTHCEWIVGFQDAVWFRRFALPHRHAWTQDKPMRLVEKQADTNDRTPKALACYGLLWADTGQRLLRFVAGRPVSGVTVPFLNWLFARLYEKGQQTLLMV